MTTVPSAATLRPPIAGLTTRPFRPGDGDALATLFNVTDEADGVDWRITGQEIDNWFGRATAAFDPERDTVLVEVDGRLVAFREVDWVDTTDGLREYRIGGQVDPDWRRRGIGRWLLRGAEEHARTLAAEQPTDRPRAFGVWIPDVRTAARDFMVREGYQPARWFCEMVRPDLQGVDPVPLPEGLELREVGRDQIRQLWDADVEAFRDHWGGFDSSEGRYQAWLNDPKFDPSLFVVAWDRGEIAGGVINEVNEAENAAFKRRRGWLASVFVRRPWRRRGLARALVLHSLARLRERGLTSAGLGVDADNPNAALTLYEQTGFRVDTRSTAYRKPMEAG